MNKFALVRVDQSYDDVFGVDCLATFTTMEEAVQARQEIKDKVNKSRFKKMEYDVAFVDAIELPNNANYKDWLEFLKSFHPFGAIYVTPSDFKKEFNYYLGSHQPSNLKDYNPPPVITGYNVLFVMEIENHSENYTTFFKN